MALFTINQLKKPRATRGFLFYTVAHESPVGKSLLPKSYGRNATVKLGVF